METDNWQSFALLVIDVQEDFWTEKLESAFPAFQDNISCLLSFCRSRGIEVIHLREVFNPDGSDWLPRYRLRGRAPCVRGTKGVEVLSVAREQLGEMVIEKQTQDGFLNPKLLNYLHSKDKRFLFTAGLVTSVCVLLTTASASQLGFLAMVVSDCCADYPEAHAIALKRYRGFLFDCVALDQIPQRLQEWRIQIEQLKSLQRSG
ncbi:MAG: cysteine hydrolase [Cyanobacteriota bacterium]